MLTSDEIAAWVHLERVKLVAKLLIIGFSVLLSITFGWAWHRGYHAICMGVLFWYVQAILRHGARSAKWTGQQTS